MRDATGEAPDGFHFLRLTKLLLESATLGDIFHEEFIRRLAIFIADPTAGDANYGGRTVLAHPFGGQAVELFQRAETIRELKPLLRILIKRTQMAPE